MIKKEAILQEQVCLYLKLQYPDVLFHSDYSAGLHLPIWLAVKRKKLNSCRALPDLYIFKRKGSLSGLALELKAEDVKLYKKNGEFKTDHIKEQAKILDRLRAEKWAVCFGIGFDNSKRIIDIYLKLDDKNPKMVLMGYECLCPSDSGDFYF